MNSAAELRLHAEHLEEVLRHRHAAEPLGLALAAQQVVADAVEREVAGRSEKDLIALAQIQQVPDLGRLAGEPAAVVIGDPDELAAGSRNGSGRSSSVLTTLKTVALAPMPSPTIRIAKVANPRSRRRVRKV